MAVIRVLIVDENDYMRAGLKASLERQEDFQVVADLREAAAAVERVADFKPQVVLLSLSVTDVTAFEACMRILDVAPDTRVVMLSPGLNSALLMGSLKAGATGFVPKDSSESDLIRVVRANGIGEVLVTAAVAKLSMRFVQYNRKAVDLASLTGREKQVLLLVADGLSNVSIAAELDLSPHTIRSHVSRILTKLGATSRAELGAYAAMIGVINQDETTASLT